MRRQATDGLNTYTGEKTPYNDPVFVAYNLFYLEADHVVYNIKRRIIEATGNVVVVTESGTTQRAASITVQIDNGQAIPVP
jgi:lipopolysaccharide assembly outer membrane protein LptD (OstA)